VHRCLAVRLGNVGRAGVRWHAARLADQRAARQCTESAGLRDICHETVRALPVPRSRPAHTKDGQPGRGAAPLPQDTRPTASWTPRSVAW
jgi:hypothetical protein